MDHPFLIVGWKEWVSLPDLNVPLIKAKFDTGATTSSIHAYNIEYFEKNGKTYVKYILHPLQKTTKITRTCISELYGKRWVKSSTGTSTLRPIILTTLQIGNYRWSIELNLISRDAMGMRMLIGRQAMDKILVNPRQNFLHGKIHNKECKKLYEENFKNSTCF